MPEEHWRAGRAVASETRGPGSKEVLTAQQLQSKKWKSFLFKDGEKVFSLKYLKNSKKKKEDKDKLLCI